MDTPNKKNNFQKKISAITIIQCFACIIIAFINSLSNLEAPLAQQNISIDNIQTWDDFWNVTRSASTGEQCAMFLSLLSGFIVRYFFAWLYLFPAFKVLFNLIKGIRPCCDRRSELNPNNRAEFAAKWFLFLLSLNGSLPFAVISRDAAAFIGDSKQVILFAAMLSYMSTRFKSCATLLNAQVRYRQYYHEQLSLLDYVDYIDNHKLIPNNWFSANQNEAEIKRILLEAITNLAEIKRKISIKPWVIKLLNLGKALGYALSSYALFGAAITYIPEATKGWEALTASNISKGSHYQNSASLSLGLFTELITLFFYARSLPKVFTSLIRLILLTNGKKWITINSISIIFIITIAYITAQGFTFVSQSDLEDGDFSYLGAFASAIPPAIHLAIMSIIIQHLCTLRTKKVLAERDSVIAGYSNVLHLAKYFRQYAAKMTLPKPPACGHYSNRLQQTTRPHATTSLTEIKAAECGVTEYRTG